MGSKSDGTVAAETPKAFKTITPVGSQLDAKAATFDDSETKEAGISKKRLGTRGLRIPLTSSSSTAKTSNIQL